MFTLLFLGILSSAYAEMYYKRRGAAVIPPLTSMAAMLYRGKFYKISDLTSVARLYSGRFHFKISDEQKDDFNHLCYLSTMYSLLLKCNQTLPFPEWKKEYYERAISVLDLNLYEYMRYLRHSKLNGNDFVMPHMIWCEDYYKKRLLEYFQF